MMYGRILLLWLLLGTGFCSFAQSNDSLANGKHRYYFSNGHLKLENRFKNKLASGTWKYYNEKGRLIKQEKYRKGRLKWTFHYNEQGRLIRIIDKKGKETKKSDCGC